MTTKVKTHALSAAAPARCKTRTVTRAQAHRHLEKILGSRDEMTVCYILANLNFAGQRLQPGTRFSRSWLRKHSPVFRCKG